MESLLGNSLAQRDDNGQKHKNEPFFLQTKDTLWEFGKSSSFFLGLTSGMNDETLADIMFVFSSLETTSGCENAVAELMLLFS